MIVEVNLDLAQADHHRHHHLQRQRQLQRYPIQEIETNQSKTNGEPHIGVGQDQMMAKDILLQIGEIDHRPDIDSHTTGGHIAEAVPTVLRIDVEHGAEIEM